MDESAKNPFSVAVGNFLRTARARKRMSAEELANRLGMSHGHVRRIEDGSQPLPASRALELAEALDLPWGMVCQLVALAQSLAQQKDRISGALDRLRKLSDSDAIKRIVSLLDAINSSDDDAEKRRTQTGKLVEAIEALGDLTCFAGAQSAGGKLSALSPIIADVVSSMIDRLSKFPPHVSPDALKEWERTIENRVELLCGYVSTSETLVKSMEDFDWELIWHGAKVRLIVGDIEPAEAANVRQQFIASLRRKTRSDSRRNADWEQRFNALIEVAAAGVCRARIDNALWFDYVSRSNSPEIGPELKRREPLRFPHMNNAWIYTVRPESGASGRAALRQIGFLDTYDPVSRVSYAVAMDDDHAGIWSQIFEDAFPDG